MIWPDYLMVLYYIRDMYVNLTYEGDAMEDTNFYAIYIRF